MSNNSDPYLVERKIIQSTTNTLTHDFFPEIIRKSDNHINRNME